MFSIKNCKVPFNKKWLLFAVAPLVAAVWNISDNYSTGYYRHPLSLKPELAANFGEVRENHFHMGLDIRTNGKENLPVYAAADGYISKVTIEEAGFGHAVYITHPNSTVTVYAHLNRFMDDLQDYITAKQYHDECWQQSVNFAPGKFPVSKGQRIAYSGNTGTSEGPHLHFEIRDAHTGNNINPLLNGVAITDNVAPVISGLYWYNRVGSIYAASPQKISFQNTGDNYTSQQKAITVSSPYISFGLEATDKNAATKYHLGIYKAAVYMDDRLVFNFALDSIQYADTRYVNACIDYSTWIAFDKCIQLLCTLPGNMLPAYNGRGTGIINLADRKPHTIMIIASDAAGNTATVQTTVQYNGTAQARNTNNKSPKLLVPRKASVISSQNAVVKFSSRAVYDTMMLVMGEEAGRERNTASPDIILHDASIPVHDSFSLQIKTTLPPGDPLRAHTVMQLTNEKHSVIAKGRWNGNYMQGYFTELGTVQLIIDTVAPGISMQPGNNTVFNADDKAIHIIYKDNAGEAAFFRAELDGHWVMFEKKGNRFTYYFDEHCPAGNHILNIIAGDKAGNITQQNFKFTKE